MEGGRVYFPTPGGWSRTLDSCINIILDVLNALDKSVMDTFLIDLNRVSALTWGLVLFYLYRPVFIWG